MALQDELLKLNVSINTKGADKGSSYLWVVGKAHYESRLSGRTRSPYSVNMLDRMVYRHYID